MLDSPARFLGLRRPFAEPLRPICKCQEKDLHLSTNRIRNCDLPPCRSPSHLRSPRPCRLLHPRRRLPRLEGCSYRSHLRRRRHRHRRRHPRLGCCP